MPVGSWHLTLVLNTDPYMQYFRKEGGSRISTSVHSLWQRDQQSKNMKVLVPTNSLVWVPEMLLHLKQKIYRQVFNKIFITTFLNMKSTSQIPDCWPQIHFPTRGMFFAWEKLTQKSRKSRGIVSRAGNHCWLGPAAPFSSDADFPLSWSGNVHRILPQALQRLHLPSFSDIPFSPLASKTFRSSKKCCPMFIVDFLLTGGASMAGHCPTSTVGKSWSTTSSSATAFLLLRRGSEPRRGRRSGSLFLKPNFRLSSGARVVSNLQARTRQSLSAVSGLLGLWASSLAGWAAAAYFPSTPVNRRRRTSIRTYLGNHFRYLASRVFCPCCQKFLKWDYWKYTSHFFGYWPLSNLQQAHCPTTMSSITSMAMVFQVICIPS